MSELETTRDENILINQCLSDNYAVFTNQTGHLQRSHGPRDFILTGPDDPEPMESGDRVTLVDQTGKESPVLVRILRAVTPRTFSARLARSRWVKNNPRFVYTRFE